MQNPALIRPRPEQISPRCARYDYPRHSLYHPRQEHTAQHNCEGINRLEHRGRNGITKHIAVNEAVDIKANRATALLCEGPEQHTEEGERHNQPQLLPLFLVFCFAINFCQYTRPIIVATIKAYTDHSFQNSMVISAGVATSRTSSHPQFGRRKFVARSTFC